MRTASDKWENLLLLAGSPEKVLLVDFKNPNLQHLTGRTLAQVAKQRGLSAEEAAIQLVIEDGSRVECVYFLMNEEDVRKNIALPWVSLAAMARRCPPQGCFSSRSRIREPTATLPACWENMSATKRSCRWSWQSTR
jgi:N-acyl-D-amino-acid deacylase